MIHPRADVDAASVGVTPWPDSVQVFHHSIATGPVLRRRVHRHNRAAATVARTARRSGRPLPPRRVQRQRLHRRRAPKVSPDNSRKKDNSLVRRSPGSVAGDDAGDDVVVG